MVICLELGADLHMAQLMPLPLAVSCFSKIQIGFTFLVPAHLGSPGQRAVKRVWVCSCSTCKRLYRDVLLTVSTSLTSESESVPLSSSESLFISSDWITCWPRYLYRGPAVSAAATTSAIITAINLSSTHYIAHV